MVVLGGGAVSYERGTPVTTIGEQDDCERMALAVEANAVAVDAAVTLVRPHRRERERV